MSDTLLKDALRASPRATPESIREQLADRPSSASSDASSKRSGKLDLRAGTPFKLNLLPSTGIPPSVFERPRPKPRATAPVRPDPPAPPIRTDTPSDGVPGYVYPAVGLGLIALGVLASRLR